jgi:raffinose/stachyose/melibiose transport system permease protein
MSTKSKLTILEIVAVVIFLVYLIPFALILMNAAKPTLQIILDPLSFPREPTQLIENVQAVWDSPNVRFPASLTSSVIITVTSVGLLVMSSSMAAWVLVRTKTKMSGVVFMIFVAAIVIPFQAVMFPLINWFSIIELNLGLRGTPFRLLRNYPGIILAYLGFGSSLSIFLYHGFIKGVPLELEEAATIDGCTKAGTFYRIVFPILKPITMTVIILNGIWIWNDFLLPQMVLGTGNAIQTLPLAMASFVGSFLKRWDMILTTALMIMLPAIVMFLFLQKYIIKGMVEGSVKG